MSHNQPPFTVQFGESDTSRWAHQQYVGCVWLVAVLAFFGYLYSQWEESNRKKTATPTTPLRVQPETRTPR